MLLGKIPSNFHYLNLVKFISPQDCFLLINMDTNFMLEETLQHSIQHSLLFTHFQNQTLLQTFG